MSTKTIKLAHAPGKVEGHIYQQHISPATLTSLSKNYLAVLLAQICLTI